MHGQQNIKIYYEIFSMMNTNGRYVLHLEEYTARNASVDVAI